MTLQFLNSVLVDDGFLEGGFQLPQTLLTFFCVCNCSCFFNTNLQMAHECIHRGFLGHEQDSLPIPHESLLTAETDESA